MLRHAVALPARVLTGAGISAALAVAFSGTVAAAPAPHSARSTTLSLKASTSALKFNTTRLSAKSGRITIKMRNPAGFPHGIAVGKKVGSIVGQGGTARVTATLKKGRYAFYCPVDGHRAAGMKGTLTVK